MNCIIKEHGHSIEYGLICGRTYTTASEKFQKPDEGSDWLLDDDIVAIPGEFL